MTQEEKQLLIKDLCGRVPYKPKVKVLHVWNEEKEIEEDIMDTVYCVLPDGYINTETIDSDIPFDDIVLYLRPMSSMTEEEKMEFHHVASLQRNYVGDNVFYTHWQMNDWLNKKMFDYRGLIPMGLALEAPEEMYKNK